MRFFWTLIALLLAAAVATILVLPDQMRLRDLVGWRPGGDFETALKDNSRVPSTGGEAVQPVGASPETAGGPPELSPILIDQLPFDTTCALMLTPDGSQEVIFASPRSGAAGGDVVAALNIGGSLQLVRRTETFGDPLASNIYPRANYRDGDGALTVVATVTGNSPSGERINIESGELTVMMAGRSTLKLPIKGVSGCE
ncbi:hypothetical protein [Lutibaculum baratangense]|uniref:Uncharacterized protein n=1 Tax=Lutibaculum baratangense AMV1 TaxID=631454 RepID=V4RWV5_9HYPH|nr:hypothetical protein [Lutibaculum baratangense]ESR27490.1 hypothetical protein N177_0013 [Lutibaculum baratangense AMV1]